MSLFGLEIRRSCSFRRSAPEEERAPPPALPQAGASDREEIAAFWASLDLKEEVRPVWPRIAASEIWAKELLPWLRGLLIQTVRLLIVERDPDTVRALQVRIMLLEGLIEQPAREMAKLKALADNLYRAGELPEDAMAAAGLHTGPGAARNGR